MADFPRLAAPATVIVISLAGVAALAAFRFGPSAWRGRAGAGPRARPRFPAPSFGRWKYRDRGSSSRARWPQLPSTSPLSDQRDRHGFATRRQLHQEASAAAARRRAPHTRPSLARAKGPLAPSDVGYPLGRSLRGGTDLRPSWEASLRLVAPPGEGKTFRALVPILRQHPGPALATSTKPDLYELSALARQRRGPVFALDPDLLAPAAQPARWSPVAGCERSEVAERRAAALVAATGEEENIQNGAFFRDSARDLLKAYPLLRPAGETSSLSIPVGRPKLRPVCCAT
jgi:type IV secretion system protein VirD4